MAQKPKTYTPKFKSQLVLEVLRGEHSEVEIGASTASTTPPSPSGNATFWSMVRRFSAATKR
jgi:hypothetical protein